MITRAMPITPTVSTAFTDPTAFSAPAVLIAPSGPTKLWLAMPEHRSPDPWPSVGRRSVTWEAEHHLKTLKVSRVEEVQGTLVSVSQQQRAEHDPMFWQGEICNFIKQQIMLRKEAHSSPCTEWVIKAIVPVEFVRFSFLEGMGTSVWPFAIDPSRFHQQGWFRYIICIALSLGNFGQTVTNGGSIAALQMPADVSKGRGSSYLLPQALPVLCAHTPSCQASIRVCFGFGKHL